MTRLATNLAPEQQPSHEPIDTAIILAAGYGSRFQDTGYETPKPLIKVAGLPLIERTILSMHAIGIRHIRIVVGNNSEVIQENVRRLKSLDKIDVKIDFVFAEGFEKGNGISLAAGAHGLDKSFYLIMSDHVLSVDTLKSFANHVKAHPAKPTLAVDPKIDHVFDLDDATKVQITDNNISAIGKQLSKYDAIDMGLFYFPRNSLASIEASVRNGTTSVSEIVRDVQNKCGFKTATIDNAVWQDVDNPKMAKNAEKLLLKTLFKPTDGFISKKLNRHISSPISLILAKLGVSPNLVTTFVFCISLFAAGMMLNKGYLWIALGGILFQLASILDGCDGEISRMNFKGSDFGAWYDTLTDNLRYMLFVFCIGIGTYKATDNSVYVWASVFMALLSAYSVSMMFRYTKRANRGTFLVVTQSVEKHMTESNSWWDRLIVDPLRHFVKNDASAMIAMVLCLLNLPTFFFWLGCFGSLCIAISVYRMTSKDPQTTGDAPVNNKSFIFYIVGVIILGWLLSRMPIGEILENIGDVGVNVIWVLAVAPLWFICNAFSLGQLLKTKMRFADLLFNELVSEGLNNIVPLAGLAGEPYRVRHLTNWVPVEQATQAIIYNKALHSLAGSFFAAVVGVCTLIFANLSATLTTTVAITTAILLAISLSMTVIALSKAPSSITKFLLKKLRLLSNFSKETLAPGIFFKVLTLKFIGRALAIIELLILFQLLGIGISVESIVLVQFFLAASGIIFFVIPQGLGIAEAGVLGAFQILNLAAPLALALGLLRRARILFWALFGIMLYVVASGTRYIHYAANKKIA